MEHWAATGMAAGDMNTAELGDCLSALPQNFLTISWPSKERLHQFTELL